jgi:hypothetical protein
MSTLPRPWWRWRLPRQSLLLAPPREVKGLLHLEGPLHVGQGRPPRVVPRHLPPCLLLWRCLLWSQLRLLPPQSPPHPVEELDPAVWHPVAPQLLLRCAHPLTSVPPSPWVQLVQGVGEQVCWASSRTRWTRTSP